MGRNRRDCVSFIGGKMEGQSNDSLKEMTIWGLSRYLVSGKLLGIHKDDPLLRFLAIVQRMSELVFPSNLISEHLNLHRRITSSN